MVDFWIKFWSAFFFISIGVFTILSVVTAIGGFFNIFALFKTLVSEHKENPQEE